MAIRWAEPRNSPRFITRIWWSRRDLNPCENRRNLRFFWRRMGLDVAGCDEFAPRGAKALVAYNTPSWSPRASEHSARRPWRRENKPAREPNRDSRVSRHGPFLFASGDSA